MWLIYNILFFVGYMALMPKYLLRMRRRGGYQKDFMERFGVYTHEKRSAMAVGRRIWVHAVSVGEAMVALQLMQVMRDLQPDVQFVISTTTSTGRALLEIRKAPEDLLLYFPADFPWSVHRAVNRINPSMLILMECELWPNLLRVLFMRKIPVFVINGRISEKSYKGYRVVRPFFKRAAQWVTRFLVQTDGDADRLFALGVPFGQVVVTGSVKYDVPRLDPGIEAEARRIVMQAGLDSDGMLWVMGSTWPGEESVLLDIFKRMRVRYPGLQAIMVPRHMERRQEVENLLRAEGVSYVKRSDMTTESAGVSKGRPVLLLADTTGELRGYYSVATLVFVGKSLGENHGGQNPIEPAMLSKAVIIGPNTENFPGVMEDMLAAGAVIQVRDAEELEIQCERLLGDSAQRETLGMQAGFFVESKRGVMLRTVALVNALAREAFC